MLKTSSQLIFILIKDERGYGMLGERNAFEQKGKEDETLQRSIGKYLYWRSQKVFPGTTTQQLSGRDQLRAVLMCHPVVLFVSRKQYLTRQKPSLWTGPGFPTAGTRGTGD